MSPLTKVFVVLLVLTSILLSAGVVVFVTKEKPLQDALGTARMELNAAVSAKNATVADLAKKEADYKAQIAQAEDQRMAATMLIEKTQAQANQAAVDLATAQGKNAEAEGRITTLIGALSTQQVVNDANDKEIAALRDRNLKLVKQAEDADKSIADLTSTVETQKAQNENVSAQLQTSQEKVQKLMSFVREKGFDPEQALKGNFRPSSAKHISGTVKEIGLISGVPGVPGTPYVTISVGTVDGVEKNMEFSVTDPTSGNYLGRVIITTVDSNESVGKLDGPADLVKQVRVGSAITNNLRG